MQYANDQEQSLPVIHALVKETLDADLADINAIVRRIAKVVVALLHNDAAYDRALEERGVPRSESAETDLDKLVHLATASSTAKVAGLEEEVRRLEAENAALRLKGENATADERPADD